MEYYGSPRISNEILDCSMPMTFDTYSNCSFNCAYCFSQYQRGIGNSKAAYEAKKVKYVNVEKIKKLFLSDGKGTCFEPFIRNRIAMQWGGLSDQFDGFEKKYGITKQLLKFFKEIRYPLSFSTKSTWVFKDKEYLKLFENTYDIWHFKISIITLDKEKSKLVESGVPFPEDRLNNFKVLRELGNKSTLRLRPFIIGVSNPSYLELIDRSIANGIFSISTEFLCLEMRSIDTAKKNYANLSKAANFDIVDFYRKHTHGCGYLRLNHDIKKPFIDEIIKKCDISGVKLGVSDAHLKCYGNLGSCCGLPNDWNYFKGQLTEAIYQAKFKGKSLNFGELENKELLGEILMDKAQGYNMRNSKHRAKYSNFTLKDYIQEKWNDPRGSGSVCSYTDKKVFPYSINKNGDVEYKLK